MAASEHGSVTRMLDRARQGDVDAKVQLWERYRNLLYAMARDGSNDDQRSGAADTSDVVAEAAYRFFEADLLRNIKDRKHLQNFLRQLVRGKKIDLTRRETARPTVPLADDSGQAPSHPDVQDFVLTDMQDLLNALPLDLHETASAFMEYGTRIDTAEALGIDRHEVQKRLTKIREIWSRKLGEE